MTTTRHDGLERIGPDAREVVVAFLAEQAAERRHVVVYLSGAHAYGFPSPDSDVDLKAVHLAPTRSLVGLRRPAAAVDVTTTRDGVELDYTSNELGPVVAGLLAGNANYVERVLGAAAVAASPILEELRPLARTALSRRVAAAYRGFARAQQKALAAAPTVKRLLYVLRTTTTGAHLLRTGDVVPDLVQLADEYGLGMVDELVTRKRAGERTTLAAAEVTRLGPMIEDAFRRLDEAEARSVLPVEPANAEALEEWLLEVRRASWA